MASYGKEIFFGASPFLTTAVKKTVANKPKATSAFFTTAVKKTIAITPKATSALLTAAVKKTVAITPKATSAFFTKGVKKAVANIIPKSTSSLPGGGQPGYSAALPGAGEAMTSFPTGVAASVLPDATPLPIVTENVPDTSTVANKQSPLLIIGLLAAAIGGYLYFKKHGATKL